MQPMGKDTEQLERLAAKWLARLGKALLGTRLKRMENKIMGRLDAIQTALQEARSTAADEAGQVKAHFDALRQQVAH